MDALSVKEAYAYGRSGLADLYGLAKWHNLNLRRYKFFYSATPNMNETFIFGQKHDKLPELRFSVMGTPRAIRIHFLNYPSYFLVIPPRIFFILDSTLPLLCKQ